MRASYRRHRVRRALTRTPVLIAAFVLLVVVVMVLDHSHQPPGCHFVERGFPDGNGATYGIRVCPSPTTPLPPRDPAKRLPMARP